MVSLLAGLSRNTPNRCSLVGFVIARKTERERDQFICVASFCEIVAVYGDLGLDGSRPCQAQTCLGPGREMAVQKRMGVAAPLAIRDRLLHIVLRSRLWTLSATNFRT